MKLNQFTGQVGKIEQDPSVRALVMQEMGAAAPILGYAEFYPYIGSSMDRPLKSNSITSGVNSRAIGSEYTPITAAPDYAEIVLATLGGKIMTDQAYERQQPGGGASEHLRQIREYARAIGRKFTDLAFNGNKTSVATDFDGFAKLCSIGQTIKFDTENGGEVPFGTTTANQAQQKKLLEYLDKLVSAVQGGPSVLAMDSKTLSRLKTVARDFLSVSKIQDALGADQTISAFNSIPIISTGFALDNAATVIGHAEECGTSENTTSIYAIKFGEKMDATFATNVGVQVITKTEGNFITTRVEFDAGLGVLNPKAIARLSGVIIS